MNEKDVQEPAIPEHEEHEEIEELIYEEATPWSEVIHSVFAAFSAIEDIDMAMSSNQDKMRIKRIRRKGLFLLDMGIGEIYQDKIDEYGIEESTEDI
jgi:hypothetical protein